MLIIIDNNLNKLNETRYLAIPLSQQPVINSFVL